MKNKLKLILSTVLGLFMCFSVNLSSFASEDLGTHFLIVDSREKILEYNSLGEMAIALINSPNEEVYKAYFKPSFSLATGETEMRLFQIYMEKRLVNQPLLISKGLFAGLDKFVKVNYI